MSNIDKKDIIDILKNSKKENRKFLYQILSIKGVSAFDVSYIMSALNLSSKKIKLIEYAISRYNSKNVPNKEENFNEYIFEVVRNIEKMEKNNEELLKEIMDCKNEIESFSAFAEYVMGKTLEIFNTKPEQNFVFSRIYIDR